MAAKPASITVLQCINPKYDPTPGQQGLMGQPVESMWRYLVKQTKNTLRVSNGDTLSKAELQVLIDDGIDVTITGGGG